MEIEAPGTELMSFGKALHLLYDIALLILTGKKDVLVHCLS